MIKLCRSDDREYKVSWLTAVTASLSATAIWHPVIAIFFNSLRSVLVLP
jgi:hypothetical protein